MTTVTAAIEQPSRDLPGAGVVTLRRGKGASAVCAMLDYGEHGNEAYHGFQMTLSRE